MKSWFTHRRPASWEPQRLYWFPEALSRVQYAASPLMFHNHYFEWISAIFCSSNIPPPPPKRSEFLTSITPSSYLADGRSEPIYWCCLSGIRLQSPHLPSPAWSTDRSRRIDRGSPFFYHLYWPSFTTIGIEGSGGTCPVTYLQRHAYIGTLQVDESQVFLFGESDLLIFKGLSGLFHSPFSFLLPIKQVILINEGIQAEQRLSQERGALALKRQR